MKRNEKFTQEMVDFISANEDLELADRIFKAIGDEAIDEQGKGHTKRTFCAIAKATAMFLGMCSDMTPADDKMSAQDFFESYADVLGFYCFAFDADRVMKKRLAQEQQNQEQPTQN